MLRPSVIFGPGDPNLLPPIAALMPPSRRPDDRRPSLSTSFPFQLPLTAVALGPCTNLYDFTYVTNAADAHVLAVRNLLECANDSGMSSPSPLSAAGRALFITNDAPLPFRDFCRAAWAELGHVPPVEIRVPAVAARIMGFCADAVSALTGVEFALSAGAVKEALGTKYASGQAAREVLGYTPRVNMREGIRRAVDVQPRFRHPLSRLTPPRTTSSGQHPSKKKESDEKKRESVFAVVEGQNSSAQALPGTYICPPGAVKADSIAPDGSPTRGSNSSLPPAI